LSAPAADLPSLPFAVPFLDHTGATIERNLALDEALLIAAQEHGAGPVLRVWEPTALAVVLGASCRVRDDVNVELCRAEGVTLARRSSGGGTVLVGPGALSFTVVLPADAGLGLHAVDTAQAFVLDRFAQALRYSGQPVEVRGHGDLTLHERKFAGSAQRRLRDWVLVHLSLLYDFPVEPIARYLKNPSRRPQYREDRTHEQFVTNLPCNRSSILAAARAAWPEGGLGSVYPLEWIPDGLVDALDREKFGDPTWVRRL
jgi:lipoate---protein ligase